MSNQPELTQDQKITQVLERLGLTLQAEYIPWTSSPHNKPDRDGKPATPGLSWRVSLVKRIPVLTTNYFQGAGHTPNGWSNVKSHYLHLIKMSIFETGRYPVSTPEVLNKTYNTIFNPKTQPLPEPKLIDVMYCLVSDSSVIDHPNFESWADDYGYDTDSREAEQTYRQCLDIALQLRSILGNDVLEELKELFQDY